MAIINGFAIGRGGVYLLVISTSCQEESFLYIIVVSYEQCYYDNSRMIYKKAKTDKEDMRNTSISAEGTRTSLVILRFLDRSGNPMSGEHKEVWQQGGAVMNDSNREGRTKTRNIQFELCEARSWIQGRDSYLHLHFTLRHGDRRSSIGGLYAV